MQRWTWNGAPVKVDVGPDGYIAVAKSTWEEIRIKTLTRDRLEKLLLAIGATSHEERLVCPECHNIVDAIVVPGIYPDLQYVHCAKCYLSGPARPTTEEAIVAFKNRFMFGEIEILVKTNRGGEVAE